MWSHRENVSLVEIVTATGALMDMVLLASGYQSSGDPALWQQPGCIDTALGWASFLEEAMQGFPATEDGTFSRKSVDAQLEKLRGPPGLPRLSCEVLCQARKVLVTALVQAFSIENGQLGVTRMVPTDELVAYLVKNSGNRVERDRVRALGDELSTRFRTNLCMKAFGDGFAEALDSKRVFKRQRVAIWKNDRDSSTAEEESEEACEWRCMEMCSSEKWRKQGLHYVNSPRTVYKLSGATVIFEGERQTWASVLDMLMRRGSAGDAEEVVELCMLKLVSDQWKTLVTTLSRAASSTGVNVATDGRRRAEVEEYVLGLLRLRPGLWWTVPPVLAAACCTACSRLSEQYVEAIREHVSKRLELGICHSCSSATECSEIVHERMWAVLLLGTMSEEHVQAMKKLCLKSGSFRE